MKSISMSFYQVALHFAKVNEGDPQNTFEMVYPEYFRKCLRDVDNCSTLVFNTCRKDLTKNSRAVWASIGRNNKIISCGELDHSIVIGNGITPAIVFKGFMKPMIEEFIRFEKEDLIMGCLERYGKKKPGKLEILFLITGVMILLALLLHLASENRLSIVPEWIFYYQEKTF